MATIPGSWAERLAVSVAARRRRPSRVLSFILGALARRSRIAAVASALVILLATTQLVGPRLPSRELFGSLPGLAALDYARLISGSIPPLAAEFVAGVLGGKGGTAQTGPGGGGPRPVAAPARVGEHPLEREQVQHALTNDRIEDAYPVGSIPFTARTDSSEAGRQPGEPSDCGSAGGTIWYRYRSTGDEVLIASTIGTGRVTSLGVFSGSPDDLEQVRCASDAQGNAKTAFPAEGGTTYFFQVATPISGPVVFHLDPLGTTERVSVSSQGEEGNNGSFLTDISADGRWVVFRSRASNLVPDDRNGTRDLFVHDRATGETALVSVGSDGSQGNGQSGGGYDTITPDGRYVAFSSDASNLVEGDTNGWRDVFVRDRWTGETTRVSVSSSGEQGSTPVDPVTMGLSKLCEALPPCGSGYGLSMSADGRFVAFESALDGLVPDDDELGLGSQGGYGGGDVFVHDRWTGKTTMVSVHSDGTNANEWSDFPTMSADGQYVAFRSYADNLVDDDNNGAPDVFLHDRSTGETTRVSVDSNGQEANDDSAIPAISASGRYVAFGSWASNLVSDDTNNYRDVFLHDRLTGQTTRVSVTSDGAEQTGPDDDPLNTDIISVDRVSVSADGRFVAFASAASNLSPGRESGPPIVPFLGIFVHDRLTGTTIETTVDSHGKSGRPASYGPRISDDGKVVAFTSQDGGLVENDNNEQPGAYWQGADAFVHTFPVLR